uniref:MPN domain-containing protein n=1 Tax=Clastoptera arizonana TaxID=38151 RepID=A0A1B6DP92_9HEMI
MSNFDNLKSPTNGVLKPEDRIKTISKIGNGVEIDNNIPPRRYYRSGLEMVRMANVYLEEGDLENAFILYMKFMTLFLEKIRKHPDFNTVPLGDRVRNNEKLREVLPKTESLKNRLLEQYKKEYDYYLKDLKRREELERKNKLEFKDENKKSSEISRTNFHHPSTNVLLPSITQVPPLPDDFSYSSDIISSSKPKPDELTLKTSLSYGKPGVDRTTKPSSLLSPSVHSRSGLRNVVIPKSLEAHFFSLSQKNTIKNVETCGILAGKLDHDHLVITHLILPRQHGSSDSCTMENEEQICEYSDSRELLTLGWIHTHPTQSAFLSSVDLHTHFSYQLMMPEAIAVVCAPKYNDTKVFCLTPYYGLDFIKSCQKVGFHPHPSEPPLFMVAEHVIFNTTATIEIVDFRR